VITVSRTYLWEVLVCCGSPPAPVAVPRAPCAAPSDTPPAEGRAFPDPPPDCIDHAINEAPNPLRPRISPCLAKVHEYFREHGIIPDHTSSDTSLDYADGLPHLVFSTAEMPVDNCTVCVMVATSAFFPLSVTPAAAIIITGIGRIIHINPFLGKLIGGLTMAYLRAFYLHPIAADMDCESVTRLHDQQKHLSPEQSQSQGRVYGLLLQAFLRGKGSGQPPIRYGEFHPENPRSATKTRPGRSGHSSVPVDPPQLA
jgi:hypothetical protein